MATGIEISVNGARRRVEAPPDTALLYVLRNDLGLDGPRFGCGLAQCGACTVHLGGRAIRACMTPLSAVGASPVTTLEGLGTPDRPHPLQVAFIQEQATQCGYCLNGMIMAAAALLVDTPRPTEVQIRAALGGNLCRCGSHLRILRAIRRAARA